MAPLYKRMINLKKSYGKITRKGNPTNTSGNLPSKGSMAPGFTLVKSDLTTFPFQILREKTDSEYLSEP